MFSPQAVNQRVDAFRGNPQALMQKYAVSQDLLDLLALQQINKEKQDAARQMQIQMAQQQGRPQTVADQVERETLDLTRQEMAQKLAPLAQQSAQMQGIAGVPAPNMEPMKMAQGGIVGYQEGGPVKPERREGESVRDYRRRLFAWELETAKTRPAAERARREAERQRLLAERGGEPLIPPSPFFDRAPLTSSTAAMATPEPRQQGAPATTNAPELMLSAPGPGGRAQPPRPPRVEKKPEIMAQPDRGGPAERMPAAAVPAQEGLASLYEAQLRNMMEAKPDFSGVDEYQRMVTDPSKAIQQRRMEDLTRREEEARAMLERRLAGMQDTRPQWLRAIQTAGASGDASKPLGGLQALARAGQTIRAEDAARQEKAMELEQAHIAMVNQLRDAGFGLEESMIKADELLFGKREGVRKDAAGRQDKGVGEAGEEVRSRRTDTTARRGQDIAAETARRGQDITERLGQARGGTGAGGLTDDIIRARTALMETARKMLEKDFNYATASAAEKTRMEKTLFRQLLARRPELQIESDAAASPAGGNTADDPLGIRR